MLWFMRPATNIDAKPPIRAATADVADTRTRSKARFEQAPIESLTGTGLAAPDAPRIPAFRGRGVQPCVNLLDNAALEAVMNAESVP